VCPDNLLWQKGEKMESIKQFFIDNSSQFEYLLRILLAAVCGAFVGFERAKRRKEAGLRTHVIVAMASALAGIVSKYGYMDVIAMGMNAEASRIASNVLTGIGFLGAGIIFVKGGSVKGLTTAAGVWATSIVGLSIGSGMYIVGIGTTLLLITLQIVLHRYVPGDMVMLGRVIVSLTNDRMERVDIIKEKLTELKIVITKIDLVRNGDHVMVNMQVRIPNDDAADELFGLATQYPEVSSIST
jgi:putative Mg2+ transporter-C (MgtC) family protein